MDQNTLNEIKLRSLDPAPKQITSQYVARLRCDIKRLIKGLEDERIESSMARASLAVYHGKEADGRLVELPCRVGDRVYRICDKYTKHYGCCGCDDSLLGLDTVCEYWDEEKKDCTNLVNMYGDKQIISIRFDYQYIHELGISIFLTREEAERAIESEEHIG